MPCIPVGSKPAGGVRIFLGKSLSVVGQQAPQGAVFALLPLYAGRLQPLLMGGGNRFGNSGAWHDVDDWTGGIRILEIYKAIVEAVAAYVFVLVFHVPPPIRADPTAGFHLNGTKTHSVNVGNDNISIRHTSRSQCGNEAAPKKLRKNVVLSGYANKVRFRRYQLSGKSGRRIRLNVRLKAGVGRPHLFPDCRVGRRVAEFRHTPVFHPIFQNGLRFGNSIQINDFG